MTITRDFKLHLNDGSSSPLMIRANQYDSGEIWRFTLFDENGVKYNPSSAIILGTTMSGTLVTRDATIKDDKVIVEESRSMTQSSGLNLFELVIDGGSHGTANFIVAVEPRPNKVFLSESDLQTMEKAIEAGASVGDIRTQVEANTNAIESERTARQTADNTLQDNINSERTARQTADNTLQDNINSEASTRASADAVLQGQIDNFVQLPSGSTAADAELVNIRVKADGTSAATAGNAVREQFSEIKNDLTLFKGGKYELLKGNFVNGSMREGELIPEVKYRVAETEIISYDRDITLNIASGYKVGVHIFINGSFSSDSNWKTGTYKIAAGTKFKIVIAKTTEDTSSTADVLAFRSAVTFTSVIDDITKKVEQNAWTIDDIKNVFTWQVGGLTISGEEYYPQTWRLRTTLSIVPYDIKITKENGFQFRVTTFDDASMTNPVTSDWCLADGATFEISAGTYFKIVASWTGHESDTYAIDDIATSFVFNAVHVYKTRGVYLANKKKIDAIKTFNPCFTSVSHQGYSTTGQYYGNSRISSYIGSFKHGFDTAETDIQFSSDGVPVCCHDAYFVDSNDNNITVVIADHTVAELKTYGYYGETIATLAEVVETCKMYGLKLELDKVSSTWTEANWTSVFNVISTCQMQDHVIWTCPWNSNSIVNRILAYNPKAKIMFIILDISLLDQYIAWIPTVMTDTSEFIFAVNYSIMTVEQLKEYNLRLPKRTNILVWTIDDPSVYRDYMPYAWGITSNKLCAKDIMF